MDDFRLLILMFICHVLDDFVLQLACLNKLKQKSWWKSQTDNKLYEHDYYAGLIVHSFSWAGWTLVPWIFFAPTISGGILLITFLINGILHMIMDNRKANMMDISLLLDQSFHFSQILITWTILCVVK